MTATIQEGLVKAELKPEEQIVDTGYVDAELLVSSQKQGIKLVGPTMPDSRGPGQSGQGLRSRAFFHRLGQAAGHLSARANELSPESGRRAHGDRFCH